MTPQDFKQHRNTLGFTQKELATEWGMGVNGNVTIRRWETGKVPVNPIAAYAILMMVDRVQ